MCSAHRAPRVTTRSRIAAFDESQEQTRSPRDPKHSPTIGRAFGWAGRPWPSGLPANEKSVTMTSSREKGTRRRARGNMRPIPELKPSQVLKRLAASSDRPQASSRRGKTKRLAERFDPTRARLPDDAARQKEEAWYEGIGVAPADVHRILLAATRQRRYYEDRLEVRALARSESAPTKRRQLRILKGAQPLLDLMKEGPEPSGDLAVRVEAWIEGFRARHLGDKEPAHRPGEDWAAKFAKDLARLFLQHGQSLAKARQAVTTAFMIAGHADWINAEKVRRMIPNRASVGTTPTP